MILFRSLLACSVTLALLVSTVTSEAGKGKAKKKGNKPSFGLVTAVEQDKEKKDEGTLTVKVGARKKKGAPATEGTEKKFTITKETKILKVAGKKGDRTETTIALADIKSGARVMINASQEGKVEKVSFIEGKKGKKKKQS